MANKTAISAADKNAAHHPMPVWFITGCSTGFGRELAKCLLGEGYRVVITARKPDQVRDLVTPENIDQTLLLELDVTKQAQVDIAVNAALEKFGRIDVLVNNAGIGYFAAIEESEEDEVRKMFEVNVFGLSRVTNAVLPMMRKQAKGRIVNMSSVGGLRSFPALGFYNATKFAVEGLTEALWQEVEPLGIHVMLVEPSGFRTDWAGRSAHESRRQISDYAATAGAVRAQIRTSSGNQPGDPVRAAQVIIKVLSAETPPHRLLLGNDAVNGALEKLTTLKQEFELWEGVSRSADFPK